jgi:hypothetical protein
VYSYCGGGALAPHQFQYPPPFLELKLIPYWLQTSTGNSETLVLGMDDTLAFGLFQDTGAREVRGSCNYWTLCTVIKFPKIFSRDMGDRISLYIRLGLIIRSVSSFTIVYLNYCTKLGRMIHPHFDWRSFPSIRILPELEMRPKR